MKANIFLNCRFEIALYVDIQCYFLFDYTAMYVLHILSYALYSIDARLYVSMATMYMYNSMYKIHVYVQWKCMGTHVLCIRAHYACYFIIQPCT